VNKADIAAVLTEIGTLLELKGENPFKTRAYQTGARTIEGLSEDDLKTRVAAGTLGEVKGLGDALVQKITELHTTGKLEFFEKLKASVPAGLVEILSIPGMGPKKVRALQEKLGVDTIDKLRAACEANQVAALDGFGEKTQEKIIAGIRNREAYGKRHLWIEAWMAAAPILEGLRKLPGVQQVESCGSLRRRLETVGDIDFLVATTEPKPIVDWFVSQPGIKEVTARGESKASVRLDSGLQADLRLVPPEQFVFTLHHLTGSKDHNVQMRQRALERGLSMSEWGLFPADDKHGSSAGRKPETGNLKPEGAGNSNQVSVRTEAELFGALGLHFIPPELREGLGEIALAEIAAGNVSSDLQVSGFSASVSQSENRGQTPGGQQPATARSQVSGQPGRGLPRLLEAEDIRGVFHNHTTASDGHNTLEEMVAAAQALGLDYLGIADHSKSSVQARGLTEARLAAQLAEIKALNASGKFKCHVFAGTECDILPDGTLDFDAGLLAQLDYAVVSIHSSFRQERDVMTARIIRAIEQPGVTMLAHLTGRLLLEREGYAVDVDKIVDAAVANKVVIELNSNPWRLDMDWRLWRKAAEKGVLTSINPDAHRTEQLAFYKIGVGVARKGWLRKDHVVNTKSLAEMRAWLGARKKA
jgi:DNA polymerase (family 10)